MLLGICSLREEMGLVGMLFLVVLVQNDLSYSILEGKTKPMCVAILYLMIIHLMSILI